MKNDPKTSFKYSTAALVTLELPSRQANFFKKLMLLLSSSPQCLKITEKVAFNIASEASYVYILSGQKFIKMPKW